MNKKEKIKQLREKVREIQKNGLFKEYPNEARLTVFANVYANINKGYYNLVEKFINKYKDK